MEHSSDKTKRELTNYLSDYRWSYQYSIFCDVRHLDYEIAKKLAVEWLSYFNDIGFRDYLRKSSDTVILLVVRTMLLRNHPSKKRFKQVYLTIYCNELINLDALGRYVKSDDIALNYMEREVKEQRLERTIETIKNQKLHDLSSLGAKKRYSVINKKLLIKR